MQQVRIDFDNPGLPQSLGVVEGESQSRIFQAALYKSGAAYTAPAGAVYSIMYRGFGPQNQGWYDTIEDGAGKRAACTVSGNVVTCELARQALRVPGHLTVVLCVSDAKGYMLKSWPIMADVRNDGYEDTGEIEMYFNLSGLAGNYLTQLEKAMTDAEATKNNLIATSTQVQKDIDAKAAETLKTIPESYTELDGNVKQLKEDLASVKNLEKTKKNFNNWANGTWNRGSKPNYTPTFIRKNDRIAFAELTFLQKGSEISVEKYDGQKYAIARWTKNKDVWTNVEYSDWFTDNQIRKIEEDEYLSVTCAMADGTSNITKNDVHIIVRLYENYNLLDAIKPKTDLKPYFVEELNDTIKKINALQTEPCLVFPLITDIHYDPRSSILQNFNDTITIIKKMSENISFDFILNLGDNINGSSNKELVLSDARYMLNSFKNIGLPYLFTLGNHDTNYDPSPKFTISETYGAFYSATPKTAKVNANSNGTDFYIDYNDLKIRIVSLNSNYLNSMFISDSSANWFKNDALNTNNVVIFCTHESPINTQNWAAITVYNGEWVKEQINNFIANGGTLVQLFGHSHADYNFSTPWLSIASNCGKFEQSNLDTDEYRAITGYDGNIVAPVRVQGTDTEQSFSVVVVRPTIKKINLVRFGAGLDREFGY